MDKKKFDSLFGEIVGRIIFYCFCICLCGGVIGITIKFIYSMRKWIIGIF